VELFQEFSDGLNTLETVEWLRSAYPQQLKDVVEYLSRVEITMPRAEFLVSAGHITPASIT